jgi:peptidoglycan/LPS O-acetylase OafA/YrhL
MHPIWGFGFFVVVNRFVHTEKSYGELRKPRLIAGLAAIGVFSYSLYLTHELVIMQSWWFVFKGLPAMVNTFVIVTPATIIFAWLFFLFCEKPYMRKPQEQAARADGRRRRPPQAAAGRLPEDGNTDTKVTALTLDKTVESEI